MISDVNKKNIHIPIRVHGIADGEHEYAFDVNPRELGLPEQFTAPVHVGAIVEKTGEQSAIIVTVDAAGIYPCDRCLEELTVPVHQKFALHYVRDDETAQITANDDEPRDVDPAEPIIDIASDVTDVVLVGIPMRRVCEVFNPANEHCEDLVRESLKRIETQGDDPRWSALKNLKLDE